MQISHLTILLLLGLIINVLCDVILWLWPKSHLLVTCGKIEHIIKIGNDVSYTPQTIFSYFWPMVLHYVKLYIVS